MPALPNAIRANTFLPPRYWPAHNFCFFLHDVMVSLLAAGKRAGAFTVRLQLSTDELKALEAAENPLDFLSASDRSAERTAVLIAVMFPAILTDMLHCIYEALEASRKAKLNVAFVLLRKPIQESLYVLESVVADRDGFAQKLTDDPIKLWSQGAGGRDAHARNVGMVLKAIGDDGRFDADYMAQLRYDKNAEDGFDGICNKAIHLFTSHPAIATGPLDINFIFSDGKSRESQWSFIYSRLPYLLSYTYQIVESVCAGIAPTSPDYLDDMQRRLAAHTILWGRTIEERYREPRLEAYVAACGQWLKKHCAEAGRPIATAAELERMKETGALPGEPRSSVWLRHQKFQAAAESSGSTPRTGLTGVLRQLGLIDSR